MVVVTRRATPVPRSIARMARFLPVAGVSALFILVLTSTCFFAWCAPLQAARDAGDARFDTAKERVGTLRLGLPEKDVAASISCKPAKGKEILEGATGLYVQTWKFPDCGIVLKMQSEHKGGKKELASVTVTAPGNLSTSGGIKIGSTENEVVKAYGSYRDKEGSKKGKSFVAGSIFDGLIFDFRDGRVVRIFLGAAAE